MKFLLASKILLLAEITSLDFSDFVFIVSYIQWEAKSPIPSPCFKTLIKQMVKLHENLVDITPQDQLEVREGGKELFEHAV